MPFKDLFCIFTFLEFAECFGLEVGSSSASSHSMQSHEAFGKGVSQLAQANKNDPNAFEFKLLASLRPTKSIDQFVLSISRVLTERQIMTAVQLRIENDWQAYYAKTLYRRINPHVEEIPLSASRIFQKISNYLSPSHRRLYLTCNEADLPVDLNEIRSEASNFGIDEVIFKSEILNENLKELPIIAQAIVDFEVSLRLPTMVGITRSTFFNVAAATSFARLKSTDAKFLSYNVVGDSLIERSDRGTQWVINSVTDIIGSRRTRAVQNDYSAAAFFNEYAGSFEAPWSAAFNGVTNDTDLLIALEEVYADKEQPLRSSTTYLQELVVRMKAHHVQTYLEIGVFKGTSLSLAIDLKVAIGIDPAPRVLNDSFSRPPFKIERRTSDKFFKDLLAKSDSSLRIDLAFIDGLHIFECALRDFIGCEKLASAHCEILVHDVLPRRRCEAARQRFTRRWTGDVWRLPLVLRRFRPDLKICLLPAHPTGLAVISNLDANSTFLMDNYKDVVQFGLGLSISDFMLNREAHINDS